MNITALDKYIEDLSKGIKTDDSFPKNESSWEELFELGQRLIFKLAALRSQLAAKDEAEKLLKAALDLFDGELSLCDDANTDEWIWKHQVRAYFDPETKAWFDKGLEESAKLTLKGESE